ncbi:PREDICTED: ras guanine nucleotide exchange factor Q [Bactrocera latifrons]|uniref:SH3 domain-containing protein 19 n=1 Tax=Bactrocera latifrons TaxID=174628 RepID=A0A0K8VAR2_BACLA|nr:PREDICTED: ras guanine nucleotide exchange factor Q [Bactrocera latifrons]XP_018790815.1 PREDICTED: ras guanine nucleotide exchange factor Q [Bactrocera latifrons]XP_018790823.1 PREDICTED: ras guanine nucleotide exchange factor Q [Bactrocera latifrons]XP_018790830.1 PREDICTED: ras guanine nucleotide exchange factor Q [Bactrocera latifrons]XP_018790839.1 PREDICTED: ras guanine nucleotide exchange factor Q [Bactrocera latifrons]XP_018790848.1 PREDICTED: ras guanine nucleotide exchange factor 
MTIPSRPAPAPPVARGQNAAAGANASIEQLRIQLQQQQIHQQQNRGVQKLTISLPPPPKGSTATPMVNRNNSISSNNNYNCFNMDSNQSAITRKFPQARYTPTTNWEDDPFGANAAAAANTNGNVKKVPPPRPPPPKVQVNGRRAPQPPSTHSTKLLSNIFKSKKSSNSISNNNNKANKIYGVSSGVYAINNTSVSTTNNSSTTTWGTTSNSTNNFNNSQSWQANWNSSYSSTSLTSLGAVNPGGTGVPNTIEAQLISFDSPPSSPTFTQKSNSDCLSVDSFSSDSNFSSPNNGSVSQPESGFEDDFSARSRPATTSPLDPWEAFDSGFNTAVDSIYGSTAATNSIGTAPVRNLNTINSRIQSSNDNPLCNGKSLLPPTPTLSVPTIIKPKVSQKPRAPKPPMLQQSQFTHGNNASLTPPSPPMPICAPPPPPNGVSLLDVISGKADALQLNGALNGDLGLGAAAEESRPHGVALYAFDGVEEGDLSFRENEKIYILEQVSAEWYRGRTRSGCEGIFPINYIDVKVPLGEENAKTKPLRLRCLYNFPAEYDGDLALTENEIVTILYKINEDWLYGEVDGRQGQFPANFIEYLPDNIPMA